MALNGGQPIRTRPFPAWPVHGDAERSALSVVVESGDWGHGNSEVERFEAEFAGIHGCLHGICVTSGTVALRLALLAAGIEAGDEVIVPSYTFQATATAVVEANAVPVFVDIFPNTYTMDPDAFEAAISPLTRFVMPVHFAGLPAEMDAINEIAARHGLTVIEDACQAHGAALNGRPVGSIGLAGCFSFQSSKNLNCGEGGIIVTSDEAMARRVRQIRNCGRGAGDPEADLDIAGNYRMTAFHGAVLNAQLTRFAEQFATRERNAALLRDLLVQLPGISPQERSARVTAHAHHLFAFRYDEAIFDAPRSTFIAALTAEGIPAAEGYTQPLHQHPLFAKQAYGPYRGAATEREYTCPVAERACAGEGAWLYQKLMLGSEEDTRDIARAFEKVYSLRSQLKGLAQ